MESLSDTARRTTRGTRITFGDGTWRGEAGESSGETPEEKKEGEIVCTGSRPAEFTPPEGPTLDEKEEEKEDPATAEQGENPELQPEKNQKED